MRTTLIVLVVAFAVPGEKGSDLKIRYTDSFKSHYGTVMKAPYKFPEGAKLRKPTESHSRHKIWLARLQVTDAVVVPYDQAKASIVFERTDGKKRFLLIEDFRTTRLRWINDRLVYIFCDIGHIAGVGMVYDVEDDRWVYQKGEQYLRE